MPDSNPILDWITWMVFGASLTLWFWLALSGRKFPPLRWLEPAHRRPIAVFGLLDVGVIFTLLTIAPLLIVSSLQVGNADSSRSVSTAADHSPAEAEIAQSTAEALSQQEEDDEKTVDSESSKTQPQLAGNQSIPLETLTTWFALSKLAALAVSIGYLWYRFRLGAVHFGLSARFLKKDIALGLVAALMILPPVMLIQTLLQFFVKYSHSTIDQLKSHPSVALLAASFLGAGVVAPIAEEFFYRLVLQGWLQRLFFKAAPRKSGDSKPLDRVTEIERAYFGRPDEVALIAEEATQVKNDDTDVSKPPRQSFAYLCCPLLLASFFFALMHSGQGAAPIPLFFLAAGIGFLFHRTQRILPCLIIHLVLNFWTLTLLSLEVLGELP